MVTGIRPTGALSIANYLGAIRPLLEKAGPETGLFVADLHGLTDNEPETIAQHRLEIVKDYLALGVDKERFYIYLQSSIGQETSLCTTYLSRLITVAELLRVPTLKDKLKRSENPENAYDALLQYPVLMAADIVLQDADFVPVGEDQVAHLEIARLLAGRFNKRYGKTLIEPRPLEFKSYRILSLKGDGKMSKSNPGGAIFLTDSPETIAKKVKTAETAEPGVMNDKIESLNLIATLLSTGNTTLSAEFADLIARHKAGEKVMADFKGKLAELIVFFVSSFQKKRKLIGDDEVKQLLKSGGETARRKASAVLDRMEKAMGFSSPL